jgi:hypothetical protein
VLTQAVVLLLGCSQVSLIQALKHSQQKLNLSFLGMRLPQTAPHTL